MMDVVIVIQCLAKIQTLIYFNGSDVKEQHKSRTYGMVYNGLYWILSRGVRVKESRYIWILSDLYMHILYINNNSFLNPSVSQVSK